MLSYQVKTYKIPSTNTGVRRRLKNSRIPSSNGFLVGYVIPVMCLFSCLVGFLLSNRATHVISLTLILMSTLGFVFGMIPNLGLQAIHLCTILLYYPLVFSMSLSFIPSQMKVPLVGYIFACATMAYALLNITVHKFAELLGVSDTWIKVVLLVLSLVVLIYPLWLTWQVLKKGPAADKESGEEKLILPDETAKSTNVTV